MKNHPCGSPATSFETSSSGTQRDRNTERCLSSFAVQNWAESKGIVRENPVPLKGIREADCTELPPTVCNCSNFFGRVKGESNRVRSLGCQTLVVVLQSPLLDNGRLTIDYTSHCGSSVLVSRVTSASSERIPQDSRTIKGQSKLTS